MYLLLGTLALSTAAVAYGLTLLLVRNPQSPKWTQDYVPVSMLVMAIISLGSIGLIVASRAFGPGTAPGAQEWLLSIAAAAAATAALWAMRIKSRLTRYAEMKTGALKDAVVIPLGPAPGGPIDPGKTGGDRLAA